MVTQTTLKKNITRRPLKKGVAANGSKKTDASDLSPEMEAELEEANRLLRKIWASSYRRNQEQKEQEQKSQ